MEEKKENLKIVDLQGDECMNCGLQETSEGFGLSKCARCKWGLYCSKKCQIADWKRHKHICKEYNDETRTLLENNITTLKSLLDLDKPYVGPLLGMIDQNDVPTLSYGVKEVTTEDVTTRVKSALFLFRRDILISKNILKQVDIDLIKKNTDKRVCCVMILEKNICIWSKLYFYDPIEQTKKIICFSGYSGVGKTTFTDELAKIIDYKCYALADDLKVKCSQKWDIKLDHFYNDKEKSVFKTLHCDDEIKKKLKYVKKNMESLFKNDDKGAFKGWSKSAKDITFRDILIFEATLMKFNNRNIFVQTLIDRSKKEDHIIVTDVSFKHEIEFLKMLFKNVIHIYIENGKNNEIFDNRHIKKEDCDGSIYNDFEKQFNFVDMFDQLKKIEKFDKFYKE